MISVIIGALGFDKLVLLIATVIISEFDASRAFKFSSKFLNFPLPMISLDVKFLPAIFKNSLSLEILFPPPITLTISILSFSFII